MRNSALLALLLTAGGCATQAIQTPLPVLLRMLPPERGGPTAYPEASPSGVVDLSGPCVGVRWGRRALETLISSPQASVGRDVRGPYLQYRDRRFRHGAWVKGGGGHFDQLPAERLDAPVPEACRKGPFLILYDIKPFDPSKVPPPKSPPPPIG